MLSICRLVVRLKAAGVEQQSCEVPRGFKHQAEA